MREHNQRDLKPTNHFSAEKSWLNDPNGCIYQNGLYHMFFQHHPYSSVWGPMHWGHAVSKDLINWDNKGIVLSPDENGAIFSGTTIIDTENKSELFNNGQGILAFYTGHIEKTDNDNLQQQCLAFSKDNGKTFTKYKNNPIVKNPGVKDFRDPKVFYHKETNKWIMVLSAGDSAVLYFSSNLINWEHLSVFKFDLRDKSGIWECPDLIKIKDDHGVKHWVFVISILTKKNNPQQIYFIGDFDGIQFTPKDTYRIADFGFDFYAAQSWANLDIDNNKWIGWCNNWNYAIETPELGWRGVMSFARNLTLKSTKNTFKLYQTTIPELSNLYSKPETFISEYQIKNDSSIKIECNNICYKDNSSVIKILWDSDDSIELFVKDNTLQFDRSNCGKIFEDSIFSISKFPIPNGFIFEDITIYIDKSIVEIYVNKGEVVMTNLIYPKGKIHLLKSESSVLNKVEISYSTNK